MPFDDETILLEIFHHGGSLVSTYLRGGWGKYLTKSPCLTS